MDWNLRYNNNDTPWDRGESTPELRELLKTFPELWTNKRVLVPGCGRAYDAEEIAKVADFVVAADVSEIAIREARERFSAENVEWLVADFFKELERDGEFDIIFEHTFFCAIPPEMREAYAEKMGRLLKPDGLLIGLFYLDDEDEFTGPPWPTRTYDIERYFAERFERVPLEKTISFRPEKTPCVWRRTK